VKFLCAGAKESPQLQGARLLGELGIGDSFVLLPIPRILWCWVSFARAFLLGRLLVRLKESRYFPDRVIDRSTDRELTQAARPTPGKIARGATQLRGFDQGPQGPTAHGPRPDPAGDGEQAAALPSMHRVLNEAACVKERQVVVEVFLSVINLTFFGKYRPRCTPGTTLFTSGTHFTCFMCDRCNCDCNHIGKIIS
jgi:hypothetical protein